LDKNNYPPEIIDLVLTNIYLKPIKSKEENDLFLALISWDSVDRKGIRCLQISEMFLLAVTFVDDYNGDIIQKLEFGDLEVACFEFLKVPAFTRLLNLSCLHGALKCYAIPELAYKINKVPVIPRNDIPTIRQKWVEDMNRFGIFLFQYPPGNGLREALAYFGIAVEPTAEKHISLEAISSAYNIKFEIYYEPLIPKVISLGLAQNGEPKICRLAYNQFEDKYIPVIQKQVPAIPPEHTNIFAQTTVTNSTHKRDVSSELFNPNDLFPGVTDLGESNSSMKFALSDDEPNSLESSIKSMKVEEDPLSLSTSSNKLSNSNKTMEIFTMEYLNP